MDVGCANAFLLNVKSESFTAATPENAATYDMMFDAACHGFEGPVQSSYLAWSHPNNSKLLPRTCKILLC